MKASHPVASNSPDRTGVCRAGRSAPSQWEMVTGPGFSSPNQPDQERTTAYRDSSGPNSRSDAHCATIVGDWEKPSGENPDSNKEKQIWVIREKKTKAGGNNRKRPSLIQRKNENRKKIRRKNKRPVLSQQSSLRPCRGRTPCGGSQAYHGVV